MMYAWHINSISTTVRTSPFLTAFALRSCDFVDDNVDVDDASLERLVKALCVNQTLSNC